MKVQTDWIDYIPSYVTFSEVKDQFLLKILKENNWNRTHSANKLGISRRSMMNNIDRLKKEGHKIEEGKHGRKGR